MDSKFPLNHFLPESLRNLLSFLPSFSPFFVPSFCPLFLPSFPSLFLKLKKKKYFLAVLCGVTGS